jgi:hypothetical protein
MIKNFNEFIEESAVVGKGNYFLYIESHEEDIEKILNECPTGHALVKYQYVDAIHESRPAAIIITHLNDKEHAEFILERLSEDVDVRNSYIFSANDTDMLIKTILKEEK